MDETQRIPVSFTMDGKTRRILHEEAERRGLSKSGLLTALVRALRDGKAML